MSKEERIQQITERHRKATKGPYRYSKSQPDFTFRKTEDGPPISEPIPATVRVISENEEGLRTTSFIATCESANLDNDANAAFLANSWADIEFLLSELEPQTVAETIDWAKEVGFRAVHALNDELVILIPLDPQEDKVYGKPCISERAYKAIGRIHSPAPDTKGLMDAADAAMAKTINDLTISAAHAHELEVKDCLVNWRTCSCRLAVNIRSANSALTSYGERK